MKILKFALLNLGRNRRRTILLGMILATGTAVVLVSAGLMETSSGELKRAFTMGLTGDFAILPTSAEASGLFGDETPIVSDYAVMRPLDGFKDLDAALLSVEPLCERSSVLGTQAVLQVEGANSPVFAFGANLREYLDVLNGIRLLSGRRPEGDERWILLNAVKWEEMNKAIGRELLIGEILQLSVFTNTGFKIRPVEFAGVYEYDVPASSLQRVVLCDPSTARSLAGYTLGYGTAPADSTGASGSEGSGGMGIDDLDDLFSGEGEAPAIDTGARSAGVLESVETRLADSSARDGLSLTDGSSWNYVILRAKDGVSRSDLRKALRRAISGLDEEYRILDWRKSAGMSAQTVFILQAFLSGGLAFVMAGVALILMNSLFIAVIERTKEIGTMRALGAPKSFIARMFAMEAAVLSVAAGAAGTIVGLALMLGMRSSGGLELRNDLLATLFGGRRLMPVLGLRTAALSTGLVAVAACLSWIVPVRAALGIDPGKSMNAE